MDFTNGFYKTENPVILEEVKTFLQSMERRGATVKSPSSRRAWIEIPCWLWALPARLRRPPRGGRG